MRRLKSEVKYRGSIFDVVVDQVEYPSGNPGVREVVRHPGGSAIVPLLSESHVLLIQQWRYPFSERLYELPAGRLDAGEAPENAAARELMEETGYIAGTVEKLCTMYPTPGYCNEIIHI